ncbi:apoptosis-inducing factor 3-like [Parasteatoda tepidariorum]|nr:apoptosis-inducing factor 3 [Parasteatoda tepidariorum]
MGAIGSKKREYKIGEKSSDSITDKKVIETVVCRDDDLEDGKMAEFEINDTNKVLLVKENGIYSAFGTKCPHYGAPLKNGVLINGKIRCPWHGACFNSKTGDIEDFPGLDSLPCYQVSVENGDVKVKAEVSALKNHKRVKEMSKYSHINPSTFVIIGGGAAAQVCTETLRQEGFNGKIILITKEKHLPYDRPKLSKALDTKASDLYLRNADFFKKADVSVMLETEVTSIDTSEKWVACNNGKLKVKYESLMIATGGQPIRMQIPGSDLKNIYYLRTPEDGKSIVKASAGKSVVIIGTSFIGMEVASYLMNKATSIHVIGRSPVPFAKVFGLDICNRIKQLFEEKGVVFHFEKDVVEFAGEDGLLTGIKFSSGECIRADVCVIGIGVKPATDYLKSSGISMNEKGLVMVDEFLKTNIDGIYACGDIVEFPLATYGNVRVNISHWQIAQAHGRVAALNMVGKVTALQSVPFFWCAMFGKNFRYAGYAENYDEVIIDGDVEKLEFVAYFISNSEVVAVCTANRDPEAAKFASRICQGEKILRNEIHT